MPLLEMREIVKEFPGVRALDGVSLTLEAGEFHALVGENGAGKSTLMKVLSGVYPTGTFDGEIVIDGEERAFRGVRDSEAAGIAIIFQELSLVKELTVGENIFLGREPSRFGVIDWSELYHRASRLLRELNLDIDPRIKVGTLGIGRQQLVEIAKALSMRAKILVLDEPTAALTESEVETLFNILTGLKERGVGMIYISHKLDEVFRMSDRITVLRDGRSVATFEAEDATKDGVIAAMVGREVGDIFPNATHERGEVALSVRDLTAFGVDSPGRKVLHDVSFEVRRGEVLGVAGLMGAGRSELLSAIFGAWQGKVSGHIEVAGREVAIASPADAIGSGIGFVTEDRARSGLILDQTIVNNMTLAALREISGGFLTDRTREMSTVAGPMASLRIKAQTPLTTAGTLSGGNQQKVVLGKWLLTKPKVLFLDEPTRGIDVGAKQEIYAEINKLAAEGLAIVLVSSELPEVLGLADRVIVLHEGRLTGEFTRDEATPEKVMAAATGH
ncbi:MAG TPA: xylose ABC transporter ATP-binding protein [Pyrinomonadaceae bacterium]|jgi:D-xylose transport system ATP-binding protein|nr:xylose ABC transporter ATP-binding protein [Pyrinomonadaceae bacterium]